MKPGAYADLIAVDSDPREHIEQLEHVKFVMKDGKVYKNDWLKQSGVDWLNHFVQ